MNFFKPIIPLFSAVALLVVAPFATGQTQVQRTPHLGFVYPAGGQQGTTVVISVGGQNLQGATNAYFAGAGIQGKVTGYDRPLTQKEFNDLRDKMQQLQEKRAASRGVAPPPKQLTAAEKNAPASAEKPAPGAAKPTGTRPVWTAEDEAMVTEIRAKMAKRPNRQGNPAIAETTTLEVTIAADAPPGDRELRLKTPQGLSNPILLQVGQLPEFSEPVVTATSNPAPRPNRAAEARPNRPKPADMEITLPATVNGQVLPGEVDRYRFNAKKGQRLTVVVSARSLLPYLADAVPGWFQATVALYDGQGREVVYGDSFRFNPDPVVSYDIPSDGDYAFEIKDSIYRGREDFVYRIAIGELPFVTNIFPLGGQYSERATFELAGWNLPASKLTMETRDKAPGTFLLSVRNGQQLSNPVRFALDNQPSQLEHEPNDRAENAQALELPVTIDGRIAHSGDVDVFRFEGKAGAVVVTEIFARRLGSPLDSALKLTDAAGHQLAFNDDYEDKGVGLMTHHADSRIVFTLPADGTYFVQLADTQHQGGPEYGYRLRVGPPHPDFELRVTPSSINARAGTHVPITVYALRRDGFSGEIALALTDAPRGFTLAGARIPAGQDKVQLTLAAPPAPREEPFTLGLVGSATIEGKNIIHGTVPAEDMMQAFAYRHLVPAKTLLVNVAGRGAACRLLTKGPLQIPAGGTAKLAIAASAARGMGQVHLEFAETLEGLTAHTVSVTGDVVEIELSCDATKIKPGVQGNLILNAFGERTNNNNPKAQQRAQRVPLGSVPAIPFEVIAGPAPAAKST
jgi:hypothetical protein